jgi:hypothetical protein
MQSVRINHAFTCAPVAQLDRAPGFGPGGREFESLRAYQFLITLFFEKFILTLLLEEVNLRARLLLLLANHHIFDLLSLWLLEYRSPCVLPYQPVNH